MWAKVKGLPWNFFLFQGVWQQSQRQHIPAGFCFNWGHVRPNTPFFNFGVYVNCDLPMFLTQANDEKETTVASFSIHCYTSPDSCCSLLEVPSLAISDRNWLKSIRMAARQQATSKLCSPSSPFITSAIATMHPAKMFLQLYHCLARSLLCSWSD